MITIVSGSFRPLAGRHAEVVERKGLGHPDTMADLIAEQFSFLYCRYCIQVFGHVLNHAVDKVTLIGASTKVSLGHVEIISPVIALLIGKITPGLESQRIPIYDLFRQAVSDVFECCLRTSTLLRHTNLVIENTFSSAMDRPANFYLPSSSADARTIIETQLGANDTVFCTGCAARSPLETLVLTLELAVTAPNVRSSWPVSIGTDVKAMAFRRDSHVDITMCVPIDPVAVRSAADYREALAQVRDRLRGIIEESPFPNAVLAINTKDADGGMYLAPFGTSLGKSDCGAVGRGNRHGGFISAYRPCNIEAPAGKNPLHHAGKLYTFAAQNIADDIWETEGRHSQVTIVARNGDPLDAPAWVHIELDDSGNASTEINRIAHDTLADINGLSMLLIQTNPLGALRAEFSEP